VVGICAKISTTLAKFNIYELALAWLVATIVFYIDNIL